VSQERDSVLKVKLAVTSAMGNKIAASTASIWPFAKERLQLIPQWDSFVAKSIAFPCRILATHGGVIPTELVPHS